jgi:GAF domain-containing protein
MTADQPSWWPLEPSVLEAFDAAALVVDLDGRVVHASAAADRLLGSAAQSLVGEQLLDLLFGDSEQRALTGVVAQALEGGSWSGRLDLTGAGVGLDGATVGCSPLWREREVVGLLWVVEPADAGRDSERDARRLAEKLTRLARVTAELVMADTSEAVTKIVISHVADAVGATMASLTLREDEETLHLVGLRGGDDLDMKQWRRSSIHTRTPVSDAIRTGKPLVLSGEKVIAERYPDLPTAARGQRSLLCLPLRVSTRTIGAIGLSFPGLQTLDAGELQYYEVLADTCAQALDRINAQEKAARQTARLTFLADASSELASSLDYQATLRNVARLAVPTFADWCAIDVLQDGRLSRVAVEHPDPEKVELARVMAERYPPDPDAPTGAWNVIRTGQSELIPEITDEMLVASARDEDLLRMARELRLRSALTVPLIARGKPLGVITWVFAESERLYGPEDVAFAEDLGKRAAIAIDNSELHSQTLAAATELQRAVLPVALPTPEGWDLASYYAPSGRTEVGGDFFDVLPLDGGRIALFVGDVMGRGVEAAAAMAQIRAAVRAYAAVDPTPASVMERLDLMYTTYPTDQLVTLVYLVVDPAADELVVANAGHPAPMVLRADGTADELPPAESAPLGTVSQPRAKTTFAFRHGDTLLAFTDGLVERRGEDIDRGLGRVRDSLAGLVQGHLSHALEELALKLRDPSRDDDVALLAARRIR